MKAVIYLIEDNIAEARKIVEELNRYLEKRKKEEKYEFEVKFLEGTIEQRYLEDDWKFYEPTILDTIRNKLEEEQREGNAMGLLLDVLLTKEDIDYSLSKYYARATIAREIYLEFHNMMPIYIITGITNFGTQSDLIMGMDLQESYILKTSLNYPGDVIVKNMFDKYSEMIQM